MSSFPNSLSRTRNIALLATSLILAATAQGSGVLPLGFDGGGSSADPVTGQIDAYTGTAGQGWVGGWATTTSNSSITAQVLNTNPLLVGSGNYLQATVQKTGGSTARSLIRREYTSVGDFDATAPHSVSFLYRFDSDTPPSRSININDGTGSGGATLAAGNVTWAIAGAVYGDHFQWGFNTGNGFQNERPVDPDLSGVYIVSGDVYAFTVDIRPTDQEYRVSVENLSFSGAPEQGLSAYTSEWLSWDNDDTAISGIYGRLRFAAAFGGSSNDQSATFSIDNISVIPEAGHLALAFGVAVLTVVVLRQKRSR